MISSSKITKLNKVNEGESNRKLPKLFAGIKLRMTQNANVFNWHENQLALSNDQYEFQDDTLSRNVNINSTTYYGCMLILRVRFSLQAKSTKGCLFKIESSAILTWPFRKMLITVIMQIKLPTISLAWSKKRKTFFGCF